MSPHDEISPNPRPGSINDGTSTPALKEEASDLIIDETLIQAENEDRMTPYLVFLMSAAALGGFLYGYDTGVIGVALPYVGTEFGGRALTSGEQEITTAACTIGSILGAAILGYFADAWGRKMCLLIADLFGFCIPFGQTIAVAIGAGLKNVPYNWRILFGLGVVPSLVQLALFHRLPESPRVLILRGEDERARAVLTKIYSTAGPEVIELKLQVIKNHIELTTRLQRTSTFKERTGKLWTHKPYRRSIFTVCLIQVFGQFTGYNTLLYYAGDLFGLLGLENAAIGGLIPSITNTFFLLCGMVMVDRIGRRGLLMKLGPIMVVGLLWCLISFYFMCKPTGGFLVTGYAYSQTLVGMVIAGIVIFCVGFGSTYAHLCWYQSEYLALEIRAVGSAISTTASFSANLVVAVTFLSELETLTPAGTYGLYLGFIIIGLVLAYYCYPETKELSVDEAFSLFDDGWGVKKSIQMRKEKKEARKRMNENGSGVVGYETKAQTAHVEAV
ncbi:hypothetical protein JCM24511_05417 [Saitozyma sp. JCM 24511]|nr:hypothetical protein JCM24511_05417 [Saitozyma sp. JCM 24511]